MSGNKIVQAKIPCPLEGCNSSDAYHVYEDGSGYCFSCTRYTPPNGRDSGEDTYGYDYVPYSGLTKKTVSKFRILSKYNSSGDVVAVSFPYHDGRGSKVRDLTKPKSFTSIGEMSQPGLFGKELWTPGCARSITITEGEKDAASMWQMLTEQSRGVYPCVSVKSSSSAKRDCLAEYDYLNSFDRIYLALDNDEQGKKASKEIASIFPPSRVYQVQSGQFKDANEWLLLGSWQDLRKSWENARTYRPENIVSNYGEIEQALKERSETVRAEWPWRILQGDTFGIRKGERILFSALEGLGKTEIVRAIEHHLLKTTDENVAIIHLEESLERTIKGLAGYELGTPCHLPISNSSDDDIMRAYRDLTGRDDRLFIHTHFGSDSPDDILATIRLLVSGYDCKFVFLDHITMVVTGLEDGEERRLLDNLSTRLAMLTEELDFTLIFVSHVNDDGLTRGSRNISKIADLHIALERDIYHPDPVERNTTQLVIKKNRFAGTTGLSSKLYFDPETFMISESVL